MIPKIIHYCWISGDPFPEKIQKCVDSWKKHLPDYEIIVWDYEKVHKLNVRWCEEAMACKKYAFVADYIRFYALYNYGGIYLDSDVEVLKPFDNLLQLKYFVGNESSPGGWEAATIGAEKGVKWIKDCLKFYRGKHFINMFGEYRIQVLPEIMNGILTKKYTIKNCSYIDDFTYSDISICKFPVSWFSPKKYDTLEIQITEETYSIHHFAASWKNQDREVKTLTTTQSFWRCVRPLGSQIKHMLFPWKYKH